MAISKETTASLVKKFGKNAKDSGSAEVQIALLTERIKALSEHMKANGNDSAARRSLMILVGKRKSLLAYLAANDSDRYAKLISELSIRK